MTEVTDAHGISIDSIDTVVNGKCGFMFITKKALRVISILKTASTATANAFILDSSKNILYTTSFVGNVATFNSSAILADATTYYMCSDNGGPVYTRNLTYDDQAWPKNKTNINYTGALDSGNDSLKGFNLRSITTDDLWTDNPTRIGNTFVKTYKGI